MKRMTPDTAIWGGFWALFALCVLCGAWSSAATLLVGAILGRIL